MFAHSAHPTRKFLLGSDPCTRMSALANKIKTGKNLIRETVVLC